MKKFSKKLFCLMLVAIMVATAIPFGAFADETPIPIHVKAVYSDGTLIKEGDCNVYAGVEADLDRSVKACEKAKINVSGLTAVKAEWDGTPVGTAAGTLTVTFQLPHTHAWKWNGLVGDASGHGMVCKTPDCTATSTAAHTMVTVAAAKEVTCIEDGVTEKKECNVCGYVTGGEVIKAAGKHTDENKDGECDFCGEKGLPVDEYKKSYKIVVSIGSEQYGTASKEMSMKEIEDNLADGNTVRAFLTGLGGQYKTLADQMANGDYLDYEIVNNGTQVTIFLKNSTPEPDPNPADQDILVIRDDGYETTLTKEGNVGRYYSNILQLGNTWGSKQAILEITDANGTRSVKWDSRDADAKVRQTDTMVRIKGSNKTVTIYFLKSPTSNPTTTNS